MRTIASEMVDIQIGMEYITIIMVGIARGYAHHTDFYGCQNDRYGEHT